MQEAVSIGFEGRELVARLKGEIDHHSARVMREVIDGALFEYKPEGLVLDFTEVGFMDSSGLGLILGRTGVAGAVGAAVRIRGMSESLMKLLRLSGIDKVENLAVMK